MIPSLTEPGCHSSAQPRPLYSVISVARRSLRAELRPAMLIPSLAFPLFFLAVYAGGLSAISHIPGFDFRSNYTAFAFVFVLFQVAAFGGALAGTNFANDFETGFAQRLLLAASSQPALLSGYVLAEVGRFMIVVATFTPVAVLAGMQIRGGISDMALLFTFATLTNIVATLWGLGVALRMRSNRAGPIMQAPVFVVLFLGPVYVPTALLHGWVADLGRLNPMSTLLTTGRNLIAGEVVQLASASAIAAGLLVIFAFWTARGLRASA